MKIMKNIICILIFLLGIELVHTQEKVDSCNIYPEVKFGIRIESNRVLEKRLENFTDLQPAYKLAFVPHSGYVFPLSLYLFLQCNIDDKWSVEFRPGILFAGEHLTSLSLGLYGNYYIYKRKSYVVFGIDNTTHIDPVTFGEDSELRSAGFHTISAHNDNEFHSALLIGIGLHLSKVFSADISISRPLRIEYGSHEIKDSSDRIDLPDGRYPMKLYCMLKLGVNFFVL